MSRTAYVNGAYVPMDMAFVHIEDRGYQFADGIYEVVSIRRGKLIDEEAHLDRLKRSLDELQIAVPMSRAAMKLIFQEVVRRNRVSDALLYIQITRGVAKRDHAFPALAAPSFVITCRRFDFDAVKTRSKTGIKVSSQPDNRWGRCDIKSTSLLPNCLAKQAAKEAGALEAMFVDDAGFVTEGSSTNMWMVDSSGALVTRSTDDNILPGITRASVMKIAAELQMPIIERAFSLEEAKTAKEIFLTSSTSCAMPVVDIDGAEIGNGAPGPVSSRLAETYWAFMDE
jgi:D-alanine transaminase